LPGFRSADTGKFSSAAAAANFQTAVARLDAEWGIDFFHLAKVDGNWMIVNAVWQTYPPD